MVVNNFTEDNRPSLPEVVPDGAVQIRGEEHTYEVVETTNGTQEITRYTLDKAPVEYVERVTGTNRADQQQTFSRGGDYELSADETAIVWLDSADNLPKPGTQFFVTYVADAIVGRYLDAVENELDTVEDDLVNVVNNSFVESATGDNLDELGKLFGPQIGKRRGRSDEQYRIYLKSVVQSFVSRGTVTGIKLAVSAATDVPIEDITINEEFDQTRYEVQVVPNTPITVNLLEEVADIADPSGIEQVRTRFRLPAETIGVADAGVSRGPAATTVDTAVGTDSVSLAQATKAFEFVASDDTAIVAAPTNVSDTSVTDDQVATTTQNIEWGNAQWNELTWATNQ